MASSQASRRARKEPNRHSRSDLGSQGSLCPEEYGGSRGDGSEQQICRSVDTACHPNDRPFHCVTGAPCTPRSNPCPHAKVHTQGKQGCHTRGNARLVPVKSNWLRGKRAAEIRRKVGKRCALWRVQATATLALRIVPQKHLHERLATPKSGVTADVPVKITSSGTMSTKKEATEDATCTRLNKAGWWQLDWRH